jgi:hypothetical protein
MPDDQQRGVLDHSRIALNFWMVKGRSQMLRAVAASPPRHRRSGRLDVR